MSNVPVESLNDKHLRLWGIPIIVLMSLLGLMPFFFPGRWDLFGWYFLAGLIYTSLTWEFCRWVMVRIRLRLPGLHNTKRRIWRTSLIYIVVAAVGQLILNGALYWFGLVPPGLINSSFMELWLINYASALFFVFLNSSIYEAIYGFSQYRSAIQKSEQLQKQQALQKLEALKNRVNPHFLFNSLTTLSALIGEDAPRAEQFVDQLSIVYRYMLKAARQPISPLGEELQFADSYAYLLKSRFEPGAFSFIRTTAQNETSSHPDGYINDLYIPALTLQNAIDFLVRTQNTPLHIQVEWQHTQLCIFCNDQPKSRAFDAVSTDWQQLVYHRAQQQVVLGRFQILIPFASNSTLS